MDDLLATQLATAMTGPTAATYRADTTTASATFTVKEKFGLLTTRGRIPVVEADITIDPDGLPRGTARLDVSRIDTGNTRRDKDLRGRRFFDTVNHPTLAFRSVTIRRTADGIAVDGLLTVRGEDCPLSLLTTLTPGDDGSLAVHSTGTFDRMTSALRRAPRWIINGSVDVVVDAVLRPARAPR